MSPRRSRFRFPIKWAMLVFAAVLVVLVAANALRIYESEHDRLMAQGSAEVHDAAVRLDTELRRMKAVLDTVAVEVEDYLAAGERTHAEVEAFMRAKTRRLKTGVDRNYLELYVARKGWYAGGLGWKPPPSFVPERRPWFRLAVENPGRTVLQPPYQAANTDMLMMSVSRLMPDGRTVVSMDVDMAPFGPMARREMGARTSYIFFLSPDGTIVAHEGTAKSGRTVVGRVLPDSETEEGAVLTAEQEGVVIFTERVVDGWCAAVAVDRTRLLAPVWAAVFWQLLASCVLLAAGFLGLSFALRRSSRAKEETTAANAMTMERALQALHSRASLGTYREFLEIVRERFDGDFCYMSYFDVKACRTRIAAEGCIFRDGSSNPEQVELDLGLIADQLSDIATDGFCRVDAGTARAILGDRLDRLLPPCSRGFRYLVSTPLLVSGRLWGALVVGFPRPEALDASEQDNLFRCADVLACAIERRATYEEVLRKNGELQVALRAAEQAERAKTTFLATMSHEIRTPLNAVIGFAEFLRAPACAEDERREYTEGILTSSKALLALINDILDLSKIEAGRMDMRGGACDLRKLFGEMREIFRFRTDEKGLAFRTELPPAFPVLALQEERVRQILLNLVGNAVKFTAAGSVSISASFADGALEMRVADTGAGISPDRQESIFNPFDQDGGVRGGKVYEGTGLGLPICRRLVESVGGTVAVVSEPGRGSVFTVRIPDVAVAEPHDRKGEASETGRLAASAADAARRRVYLVDDVPLNLRVAARHVQMRGFAAEDIRTFVRAQDALDSLRAAADAGELPVAVLTDMWMPGMDGAAFARAIRSDPRLKDVPVVALTADADSASTFDVSLFDAVLTKPLTGEKIRGLFASLACPRPFQATVVTENRTSRERDE